MEPSEIRGRCLCGAIELALVPPLDRLDRDPEAHVSWAERVPWLEHHDTLPRHDGKG